MPSKDLVQVVAYVEPDIKKLLDAKVQGSQVRMSMSSYIAMLIRRDLKGKKAA